MTDKSNEAVVEIDIDPETAELLEKILNAPDADALGKLASAVVTDKADFESFLRKSGYFENAIGRKLLERLAEPETGTAGRLGDPGRNNVGPAEHVGAPRQLTPSHTERASATAKFRQLNVAEDQVKPLLEKMKGVLGDRVKDVKASVRLSDSPSCIVSDEDEPSMQMQQMLKAMGQSGLPSLKPTLEINPDHEIVKELLGSSDEALIGDASWLLLEQALLIDGLPLDNPATFVQRLNRVLRRAV